MRAVLLFVAKITGSHISIFSEHFYYENANMWRITDDFWDNWDSLRDMFDRCRNWQLMCVMAVIQTAICYHLVSSGKDLKMRGRQILQKQNSVR